MADIFGFDTLLAQIMVALGSAMVAGNGFAMWKNARGDGPKGFEGVFRPGRARFLLVVGIVIAVWGLTGLVG